MEMLLKPRVWLDAANQVFYSCCLAFGSIIIFGSKKPRTNKNCVMNHWCWMSRNHTVAHTQLKNCSLVKELDDFAQGTGFAFIVMADVFTKIPGAPLWSALFLMMLLSLGLGSQIGILEGVMSTLFDRPILKHIKKPVLVGCVAAVCFSIGLVFTTGAGEYWLTLFDNWPYFHCICWAVVCHVCLWKWKFY